MMMSRPVNHPFPARRCASLALSLAVLLVPPPSSAQVKEARRLEACREVLLQGGYPVPAEARGLVELLATSSPRHAPGY